MSQLDLRNYTFMDKYCLRRNCRTPHGLYYEFDRIYAVVDFLNGLIAGKLL